MRILVLVGPKGCGKTTLGRWLEERAGVSFLEVEAIARRVLEERGGPIDEAYARACFDAIRAAIDETRDSEVMAFETTAASEETSSFLDGLREAHDVRLIRVRASADVCAHRIRSRDSSRQVEVSEDLVRQMHRRTESLDWEWDLEIDNDAGVGIAQFLQLATPFLRPR